MTTPSPDPQPEQTPGLEPGGGVAPGDTPPGEASATSGVSEKQPSLPSGRSNKLVYGIVLITTLIVAVMFIGYAVGLAT